MALYQAVLERRRKSGAGGSDIKLSNMSWPGCPEPFGELVPRTPGFQERWILRILPVLRTWALRTLPRGS